MMPSKPRLGLFWGTLARLLALIGALGVLWMGAGWLQAPDGPLPESASSHGRLLVGLLAVVMGCLLVAWTAWKLNRPVEALHEAAGRLRDGDLDSRLDELSAVREIREVSLLADVSVVLTPAYPASSVTVAQRSYAAWLASQETPEPAGQAVDSRSALRGVAAAWSALLRLKRV